MDTKDFYIELDKKINSFNPGEIVTGKVRFDLNLC